MTKLDILFVILIFLNLISFSMFVSDKNKARKGKYRTSENALLLVSLIGPFGAAIGMNLVRHKTRKVKFWLVYVFVLSHVVLIAYVLRYYEYISF